MSSFASSRAADALVSGIEARIASGDMPDGTRLPAERDLMTEFGLSRTVVREAIATLASRGLVICRPRHRPVVRSFGGDAAIGALSGVVTHMLKQSNGIKNLYDLRILLEAALVRHAAQHARKDDIAALRAALEQNRLCVQDALTFDQTDVAFHALLYRMPGNPVLPTIHQAFVTWLHTHWLAMPRSPEQNMSYYLSHRDIFQAIQERDPDGAERALLAHLGAAWEAVRVTFEIS